MTTIVKAADAASFLSLVPRMLGYRPSRSLVMVPFDGTRSIGAMRFDLPDATADVDRFAATVVGLVCRLPDADAVAAAVFTDAPFDGGGMPHPDLFEALERRVDESGLRMGEALCLAADGWGSRFDTDLPAGGRALTELGAGPPGAEGFALAERDQASGAELPAAGSVERERMERALSALTRAVGLLGGSDEETPGAPDGDDRIDPQALAAACALDDLPALFEDALTWRTDQLSPFDAATVAWCLARPALRDVALVQWAGTMTDGDAALEAQVRWEAGEEYPDDLAMRMWGDGERPDIARLEQALQLLRHVAALAPRASRPGTLSLCAWLSWALGRSTHADAYASAACEIEPDHGLSEIVKSFVQAGHLPDWAFQPGGRRRR